MVEISKRAEKLVVHHFWLESLSRLLKINKVTLSRVPNTELSMYHLITPNITE